MPLRRPVRAGGVVFLLAALEPGNFALAQEPSGKAVGVIPDASALRPEGRRLLAVQQPVYMGDRIQTGSTGEAQIIFVDTTRLLIGPASSLLIDSSILKNRRTLSSFVVSALRGTFRFISGSSPKSAYGIRTPTATIGVRGTQFDFTVLPNGGTEFVLFHGQAQVCDRAGNCITARRACDTISVPPNGPIRFVGDRQERNARLRSYLPYVRSQPQNLRRDFRADTRTCGNIAAIGPPADPGDPERPAPALPAPALPAPALPSAPPSPALASPSPSAPPQAASPAPVQATPSAPTQEPPQSSPAQPSPPEPPNPPAHDSHHEHKGGGDHGKNDRDKPVRDGPDRHGSHDRMDDRGQGRHDDHRGAFGAGRHGDTDAGGRPGWGSGNRDGRSERDHGSRANRDDGHDRTSHDNGHDGRASGSRQGRDSEEQNR